MTDPIASVTEDVAALVGIWLILHHPLVMLGVVAAFMLLVAWMAPKAWRGLRSTFRRTGGRGDGPTRSEQSRAPEGGGEVTLRGVQQGG